MVGKFKLLAKVREKFEIFKITNNMNNIFLEINNNGQGFFLSVSGAEIRPHSQCKLGDFFPNWKKKIPNHS